MKIDRLVSIIMILLDKRRISAQELADRFEVSPRTIYRDIDTIDMAGIPIRSTSGVGGGFEIMPEYKLDKKVFSSAELSAILMGLSSLSTMIRGDELVHALAKVGSFVPAERAKDIELRRNQVHIDLSPWMGNRNVQAYLEATRIALQERRLLTFDYADRYGNTSARTAEPHQLVLKSNHWYVYGYCRTRKDFRLFRLSRMSNLQTLEDGFEPRDFDMPQLDATEVLSAKQTRIKIRVHGSVLERVLDHCSYEDVLPDGDEHYIVSFPFIDNEFYFGVLFSLGDKCECLEPPQVRAEMERRIRDMAAIYDG
jgi:predicted DNA-binding transcriptional regulator YafY